MNKRKSVSMREALSILVHFIPNGRATILGFAGMIIIETSFAIAAPLIIRRITNSYAAVSDGVTLDENRIAFLLLTLAGCYILGALMKMLDLIMANHIAGRAVKNLRNECNRKLNKLPLKYFDSNQTGDILSRITSDLVTVYQSLQTAVILIVSSVTTVVAIIAIMLNVKATLALVFIIIIPILYAIVMFVAKGAGRRFIRQRKLTGAINGYVNDICENHLIVQSFGFEERAEEEFARMNENYRESYISGNVASGLIIPLNKLFNNTAYIGVCVIGATLMAQGNLDLGGLQAFLFYTSMIEAPNRALAFNLVTLQNGMAALSRTWEFINEDEETIEKEISDGTHTGAFNGDIEFSHVQFGYNTGHLLMKDVNFSVKKGMKVAVVGPSGAGKTTLVNLLMRFYDISSGGITIDGISTADMTRRDVRAIFGMVLQDSWIFTGTIADNICYGKEDATREDIMKAAEATGCDTFIEKLPDKYDTMIYSEGEVLSEGEKQLLCIARVALYNPPAVILDEATSQVDTQTESLIMSAIEDLMRGRVSFIIAHRLYTIQNADMILCMQDGDIVEAGTHTELLQRDGLYASLFKAGFDD